MQVCTSLQTDNHASTPPLSFFADRMSFLPPNQQRQSTEGNSTEGSSLSPPSASIMPCEELRRDYAAWMPSTAPPRSHAGVLMNDDAQLTVPTQTANSIRSAVKRRSVDVLCCRFHGRLKVIAVFTSRHLTTGTKMPISHIC